MSSSSQSSDLQSTPLNKLDSVNQLDNVLSCLMVRKPPFLTALEIVVKLEKKKISTKESDVIEILNKLIKDGFVVKEKRSHLDNVFDRMEPVKRTTIQYSSTFEGRVWFEYKKGYRGQYEAQEEDRNRITKLEDRQRKIQKYSFWLTLTAGLVGILVFIVNVIELYLHLKEKYPLFPYW